jgi:ATP-dependent Clp protease ATP-binding subunit ClpA
MTTVLDTLESDYVRLARSKGLRSAVVLRRHALRTSLPLRRFIAHEVETRIARALLGGDIFDGALIRVDARDGDLAVDYQNPPLDEQDRTAA